MKKGIGILIGILLLACLLGVASAETVGGTTKYTPQTMTPFGGGTEALLWELNLDTGDMKVEGKVNEAELEATFESSGKRWFAVMVLPRKLSFAHEVGGGFNGKENERIPGRVDETTYETPEEQADFVRRYGFIGELFGFDDDAREASGEFYQSRRKGK